ncbi:hypothetical protein FRC11_010408 [Ceratobasidium sp. 423]|nr:hypothetical protein FRC11_010408 [Ceratobasidium sp. 423]
MPPPGVAGASPLPLGAGGPPPPLGAGAPPPPGAAISPPPVSAAPPPPPPADIQPPAPAPAEDVKLPLGPPSNYTNPPMKQGMSLVYNDTNQSPADPELQEESRAHDSKYVQNEEVKLSMAGEAAEGTSRKRASAEGFL